MNTAQTVAFLLRRVGSHGSGAATRQTAGDVSVDRLRDLVTEFLATHSTLGAAVRRTDRPR